MALRLYNTCSTYVRGFVTLEVGLAAEQDAPVAVAMINHRQRTVAANVFNVCNSKQVAQFFCRDLHGAG